MSITSFGRSHTHSTVYMKHNTDTLKYFQKKKQLGEIEEYEHRSNGLRVLFCRVPHSDTVITNIVYLVGSRHEGPGKTGVAHMLEHMLFKDTRDKNGVRAKMPRHIPLQNKGALLNASTWTDRTNYYFVLPPEYLGDMLEAEAERMRGLIISPKEFKPEQQNVLSEYEMYAGRPEFILDSAINAHAFISHGYGHDTIGYKSDIESLTCDDLRTFYDTYYWPNNAYVVVAGDVMRDDVLRLIHTHFGHIGRSPRPFPTQSVVEPPRIGRHNFTIRKETPLILTTVSCSAPSATDPDWVVLEVALSYLASGKLSPLYKALVESHKASGVHAALVPSHDPGALALEITATKGTDIKVIHAIVFTELEKLRSIPIRAQDLVRVKNKLTADILYGRDGVQTIVRELTEYIAAGMWEKYASILDEIRAVTPQDVMRCAQKYLREDTSITGTLSDTP